MRQIAILISAKAGELWNSCYGDEICTSHDVPLGFSLYGLLASRFVPSLCQGLSSDFPSFSNHLPFLSFASFFFTFSHHRFRYKEGGCARSRREFASPLSHPRLPLTRRNAYKEKQTIAFWFCYIYVCVCVRVLSTACGWLVRPRSRRDEERRATVGRGVAGKLVSHPSNFVCLRKTPTCHPMLGWRFIDWFE